MNLFIRLAIALLALLIPAHAQTGTGVIRGTVYDVTKSSISAAKIAVVNQNTNATLTAQTTAEGDFQFPGLAPAPYLVTVEAAGFKRWSGRLTLETGQTAILAPSMEVGSVEATVEVSDAAPVINTEGMGVAGVKDALRIHQLPLNQRSVSTLFNLTPGVEGGANPRVNGLKVGATEMLFDGISLVDRFGGGIARVQPGLDTVQEFRIETIGSSARYSRPSTVTLASKSGTNELHGTFFETFRNNSGGLRARQRQDGAAAAKLIRNEFGGSAGGPVLIPKLYNGKNRTFWFASYEALRQREAQFYEDYVPTAQMWDGNFSQVIDSSNTRTAIYDPATTGADGRRTPFAGNIIPRARFQPIFATMRDITHTPTSSANPFQDSNLRAFYPIKLDNNNLTLKGDHRFSDKDNISGRFTRSTSLRTVQGGVFGAPREDVADAFGTGRSDARIYSTSIRHNHIFSPRFFSELLVANHRSPKSSGTLADFTDWPTKLGLPNPFGARGWPSLGVGDDPFYWDADNRKDEALTAWVIEDNLTLVKGRHNMQFGGKIRREYNNVRELQQSQGSHEFGGDWTALYSSADDAATSYTGVGLASLALGLPTYLSNQYNRGFFYFQQSEIGLYFHDNWKVSRRLTVDLGVRWDKWTPYKEKYNRLVNVDLRNFAGNFQVVTPGSTKMESIPGIPPSVLASWAARGLTWKTANETGLPSSLIPADNNNFGPRVGFAFRINDKTVLRGGYGEYFWTMPLSQILQTSRTNPPLNLRFTNQIGSRDGTSTYAMRNSPRPEFLAGNVQVSTEGIVPLPVNAQQMMPWDFRDWRDNRAQSWHFTMEREILRNTALRLNYIGDHGSGLEQRYNINAREAEYNYVARTGQAPPGNRDLLRANQNWNFLAANHTGYSNSHSLQAEVEKRYSNGLAFQWFYVFTRSLTTTDAGGFTSGNGNINSTDGVFAVPESSQLLGAPNLTYDRRLRLGYQNSSNIPAHRVRYNALYDLPFGKGKKFGGAVGRGVDALIGGWQLATIGEWRGGNWLSVNSARYLFGDPSLSGDDRLLLTFAGRPQRLWFRGDFDPALASNVDQTALLRLVAAARANRIVKPLGTNFDNRVAQTLANGSTRQTPVTDTVVWNSRAFFRGPGDWNVDASVFKNFRIVERATLRFTADFFNALNHPTDQDPNNTTGLQDLSSQRNQPRIIQFSLRLTF
ncbi:MAG: carboxypeptidase regulatory-like domain-containing protein [Acidobacteria bacterium]|nr:carboxypeptidase regulatory-like domain-containing protein [Acidobacteriota bacterium]